MLKRFVDQTEQRRATAWLAIVSLLASLLLPAASVAQQANLEGREIVAVEYRGLETLIEESMSYYLDIEIGTRYDPAHLNARIKEFWDRDLIDDVAVEAVAEGQGVKLLVTVVERPTLISIDYEGLDKVKRSDIADAADRERIELYEGLPLNRGELVRLRKVIESVYEEKGYRFAEVSFEIERESPTEHRIIVTVDEGNKVKIGRVDFEGNEIFANGRLRSQMKKTKKSNLITKIRKRDIYNPATVDEDLGNVRDLYQRYGYKDVQTGDPVVEVIGGSDDGGGKRRLRLIVPIEEGPRWKLGEVVLEGNEVLSSDILQRVFEEPKGGWLRSDVIDAGIERINEFYQNTGYIFARVETEVVERDAEELIADVVVKIQENDQFRVGRIEFQGNSKTRDRVLRRELRIQEGMVFNSAALKNSLLKINQLEYFKLNEDEPVDLDYDAENKLVNLRIKGEEAERMELQFGGGYSELDGFFGQAAVRSRNFLGRGETLGVSFQSGRFRDSFDLSYFVPWLLDRPQSLGLQIFDRDLDFDLIADQRFIRKERGAIVSYGRSFRLFESLSLAYNNSDFEDLRSQRFFFGDDPEGQLFSQEFSFKKSSLTATYRYDSHDSRLEPTQGKRLTLSLEYAGGFLGGENYFIRPILNASYTRTLSRRGLRTVGRVNLEASYIEPFGNDDAGDPRGLFFLDRFLLGGEQSIRGYSFRSIWVRDPDTGATIRDINGFPQGGNKSFLLNLEYHFLIGDGPFRLIAFADFGNVYAEDQDLDFDHMRKVAGLELRINVPLFGAPLRFIWSNNLDPLDVGITDDERFESFDFSIGVNF